MYAVKVFVFKILNFSIKLKTDSIFDGENLDVKFDEMDVERLQSSSDPSISSVSTVSSEKDRRSQHKRVHIKEKSP